MIHHLSIAAREPERVAEVLAELMGGVGVPDAENLFVWQLGDHGSGVEVYPAGQSWRNPQNVVDGEGREIPIARSY